MTITAALVKELREKTGVGMMACKNALEASNGVMDDAVNYLREKGLSKAAKKSERNAKEGRIVTYVNNHSGVILELNCETDFVANNETFIQLGENLAEVISQSSVQTPEAVLSLTKDGQLVSELISDHILKLGENIVIGQFKHCQTETGSFSGYTHTNGKIGVLVAYTGIIQPEIGRDIAMQVAAMNPPYVSQDQVPTADLDSESTILRQQAIAEGKPEAVVDKIVQGRLAKFYKENCLIEQAFVKNPDQQIKDLFSNGITVDSFERLSLV